MKHIITAGCSFTQLNKKTNGHDSWAYHLKNIINDKPENEGKFKFSNLGLSGTGNYIISLNCISKIETLLENNVNPEDIIVFLQWTGLFRPAVYNEDHRDRVVPFDTIEDDFKLKEVFKTHPYGFVDTAARTEYAFWLSYYDYYYSTPAAFIDNLNSILKTQWYLKSKNIQYKMFNAWDIFTTYDGSNGRFVSDKMLRPNQFSDGEYSNIENTLLADKYPISKIFWDMLDFDHYWFFNNETVKYGGMTQWVQNNLPLKDWYVGYPTDVHPSNTSGKLFTKDVIIPLLTKMLKK